MIDIVLAAVLSLPVPVFVSGAPGDSVVPIPGITVVSERALHEARRRHPTASYSEIVPRASLRALATLPEALAESPGVRVVQYGGLGAFSTVSLRGAPASQVAVYVDGVPLAGPGHSIANLADVPVGAVERIEVWRGASPLALGAPAGGGAVNLVTRAAATLTTEVRGTVGSFGTWDASAVGGARVGRADAWLQVDALASRGDFTYLDDNGTPFNAGDDSVRARSNNRIESASLLGTVALPLGRWRVTARQQLMRRRQGVPGVGAVPAAHTAFERLRSATQLDAAAPGRGAWPELRMLGAYVAEREAYDDPNAELGLGRHASDDAFDGARLQAEAAWNRLPGAFALQVAGDARRDDARLEDPLDPWSDPPPSRRDARGLAAALAWKPWEGRLVLNAAARRDWIDDALHASAAGGPLSRESSRKLDAPQLGARALLGAGLETRANWSRAARPPDFLELFGNQGSVLGNPALVPEHTEAWDLGLAWEGQVAGRRVQAGVTHFHAQYRDLILYVRNSQSSVRAQNVSSARIEGDEWSAALGLPFGFSFTGSFTAQRAVDTGPVVYWNSKRLPQRPARDGYARLDWTRGDLRASADLHWIDDNPLDRYNRYFVAARRLFGVRLAVPAPHSALSIVAEGKNLTDDRASDVAGFPLPGRSYFLSCEARLGGAPAATAP